MPKNSKSRFCPHPLRANENARSPRGLLALHLEEPRSQSVSNSSALPLGFLFDSRLRFFRSAHSFEPRLRLAPSARFSGSAFLSIIADRPSGVLQAQLLTRFGCCTLRICPPASLRLAPSLRPRASLQLSLSLSPPALPSISTSGLHRLPISPAIRPNLSSTRVSDQSVRLSFKSNLRPASAASSFGLASSSALSLRLQLHRRRSFGLEPPAPRLLLFFGSALRLRSSLRLRSTLRLTAEPEPPCSRRPPPPALPLDPPSALASGISSGPSVRLGPPTFHRLSPLRLFHPINSRLAPRNHPSGFTFELSSATNYAVISCKEL